MSQIYTQSRMLFTAYLLKGEKNTWGSNYLRMWCLISWHFFHFICHYGFVEDVWCLSTSLHAFSFLSQHLQMVYSYHEITKYTYRLHDVNPTYTMLQRAQKNSAYSFLTPAANTLWILEWHLQQLFFSHLNIDTQIYYKIHGFDITHHYIFVLKFVP